MATQRPRVQLCLRGGHHRLARLHGETSHDQITTVFLTEARSIVQTIAFSNNGIGPNMAEMAELGDAWNDLQGERRRHMTVIEVLAEYQEVHSQVMARAIKVPEEANRENGRIPWYGPEYCLDDFVVYASYGHKREHSAQINGCRGRLED